MKQLLIDFLKSAKQQIFGVSEELPRKGKLILTKKAHSKMVEWGMSEEEIKLTYEYGVKTSKGKGLFQISRTYHEYSENFWYVEQHQPVKGTTKSEKVCLVITCWKGRVRA